MMEGLEENCSKKRERGREKVVGGWGTEERGRGGYPVRLRRRFTKCHFIISTWYGMHVDQTYVEIQHCLHLTAGPAELILS